MISDSDMTSESDIQVSLDTADQEIWLDLLGLKNYLEYA